MKNKRTPEEIFEYMRPVFFGKYDDVGKIIIAHLKVEQEINNFIDRQLQNPAALKSAKLEYQQRIHLALAMGLSTDLKKPLLALGELRNSFAHKVNYQINKNMVDNFYRTLTPKMRERCQMGYNVYRETIKTKANLPTSLNDLNPQDRLEIILAMLIGYLSHYFGFMGYTSRS